jgi:hypothetical protein
MPQRPGSYLMVVVPALEDRWAELGWDDGLAKKISVIRWKIKLKTYKSRVAVEPDKLGTSIPTELPVLTSLSPPMPLEGAIAARMLFGGPNDTAFGVEREDGDEELGFVDTGWGALVGDDVSDGNALDNVPLS